MRFYNIIDDKNRFVMLKFSEENGTQQDSHIFSYMCSRKLYQEMGQVMGLDRIIELKELK